MIKIAIIDDDNASIDALVQILKAFDDTTIVGKANNGTKGISLVRQEQPDMLFLDVEMPDMTGLEFLSQMKSIQEHPCQVIIYTAHEKYMLQAFRDKAFTENVIYERLLSDKLAANLGYLYENIVAQILTASGNKLFYHSWPTESGKHNYEVDFLLSHGTKILPIEVKSSSYKTHASLDAFCKKFSSRITNERYLVYTKDYAREESVKYLPAYLSFFL